MFIAVLEESSTGLCPDSDEFSPSTRTRTRTRTHSYFNPSPNGILSYTPVTLKCSLPLMTSTYVLRVLTILLFLFSSLCKCVVKVEDHDAPHCAFCSSIVSILKHNQQDATLYSTLCYWQRCACFKGVFRLSSGAQICTCSVGYLSTLFAATASGSKQVRYNVASCWLCLRIH